MPQEPVDLGVHGCCMNGFVSALHGDASQPDAAGVGGQLALEHVQLPLRPTEGACGARCVALSSKRSRALNGATAGLQRQELRVSVH